MGSRKKKKEGKEKGENKWCGCVGDEIIFEASCSYHCDLKEMGEHRNASRHTPFNIPQSQRDPMIG